MTQTNTQSSFLDTYEDFAAELKELSASVWNTHQDGQCPVEAVPTPMEIDTVITADTWAIDAREEFSRRWGQVGRSETAETFEVSSMGELVHRSWLAARAAGSQTKHPLAPLIRAWQERHPLDVEAVRDTNGNLRSDTIVPRIAMRDSSGSKTDRLYLPPAHMTIDSEGNPVPMPGFSDGHDTGRIPSLPLHLYDLGVKAGEARGGRGAAPIPARMLVKLAAAPSASVRHGNRFVSYKVTLGDIRSFLYPAEYLDGRNRKPPKVSRLWPRVRAAIRAINQDALIPILDSEGYGRFHQFVRISENFGRIDLKMPIEVVLDIPPEVVGGVQLPGRLDQWGAESAPAYRALLGLSFLWHEPGRTHAPTQKGKWLRLTSIDPYEPLSDDNAIRLAFPNTRVQNRGVLVRRAWNSLENLHEHGELRIDDRRILPPEDRKE